MHRLFCSTLAAADASEPGSHSGHQPSHSLRQVVFSPCKSDPSNETHDKTLSFFWPTFESPALQLDSRRPQTRQSPAAIPATSRRIHSRQMVLLPCRSDLPNATHDKTLSFFLAIFRHRLSSSTLAAARPSEPASFETNSRRMDSFVPGHQR